jgi:hypothetical protein
MCNKYFQESAPWALSEQPQRRATVLFLALETLRVVGLLLQPVIPQVIDLRGFFSSLLFSCDSRLLCPLFFFNVTLEMLRVVGLLLQPVIPQVTDCCCFFFFSFLLLLAILACCVLHIFIIFLFFLQILFF